MGAAQSDLEWVLKDLLRDAEQKAWLWEHSLMEENVEQSIPLPGCLS
jgi:hypothetical protein